MDHTDHINIFFEEKNTQALHQQEKELLLPESLPYLVRGDSSKYIDQFFAKEECSQEQHPAEYQALEIKKPQSVQQEDEEFSVTDTTKFTPSSFHNFQKHLTISLKHAIQIQQPEGEKRDYHDAAVRLWKLFKGSSICTKKVLHLLLGQNNEHEISIAMLKQFGLQKIYEEYDQKTMKEARSFLARQTLRQMSEGKIDLYIESKKLKDKQRFKKYLQIFKEQLLAGFLRKRLSKEKALELQKCCC